MKSQFNDVGDSVVLIHDWKIVAAGPASQIAIPIRTHEMLTL
jgi:hypothetical protein